MPPPLVEIALDHHPGEAVQGIADLRQLVVGQLGAAEDGAEFLDGHHDSRVNGGSSFRVLVSTVPMFVAILSLASPPVILASRRAESGAGYGTPEAGTPSSGTPGAAGRERKVTGV